ncbi:MAG: NADH-quinone oxidoreductase subunit J [Chloroflexota bacterium]
MTIHLFLFLVLALIAIAAALGMLFSRNAVYAALYLVINFCTIAILYLTLSAPFLAIAQVTVYAGAIMVLFLFVIMLLGAERHIAGQSRVAKWHRPVSMGLGLALLLETGYIFLTQRDWLVAAQALTEDFGSPQAIGKLLFSQYVLPFEITSILLLTAMVGAIVLTRCQPKEQGGMP